MKLPCWFWAIALCFCMGIGTSVPALAQVQSTNQDNAPVFNFKLPQQSLADSLAEFSRIVNQTLVYNPAIVAGIDTQALIGDLQAEQGLKKLLANTSLVAHRSAYGWIIKQQDTVKQPQPLDDITPPTKGEPTVELVTVGFRGAVMRAKYIKRETMIAQDVILAEDVADFPDLNLADSLQRVAGITITREGGEGRQISLRGLGPDFTRVQVNGMEALGTSSSPMDARGAVGRSRAFDFNIFASELFKRIDVNKSYSADQEEGGIGGTVALFTAKPFDYEDAKGAISINAAYNDNSKEADPRLAALISNHWDKFGALVSVAYSERHTTEYGTNTTRWRKEEGKTAADPRNTELQAELDSGELWFPRGHRYSLWNNLQKRLGVTAALQYQASDDLIFSLDLLHGKLENEQDEHHNAVKDNTQVNELEWAKNKGQKEVVYASYKDATWRAENTQRYNQTSFEQITLSADWSLNSLLSMQVLLGTSSFDYQQPKVHKSNIQALEKVDIVTDFRDDRFYGLSTSPAFDMTEIGAYQVKDLYFQEDYISNDFDNAKVDWHYLTGDSSRISFGINYKKFANSGHQRVKENAQKDAPLHAGETTLTKNMVDVFTQDPDAAWLEGDLAALQAYYGLAELRLGQDDIIKTSEYTVTEQTSALYAQYDWQTEFVDSPLRISAGVRYYDTKLSSAGTSAGLYTENSRNYAAVLPSLNLKYELSDDIIWRFGASKNVTRPSLSDVGYHADVSQTSGDKITDVRMGNPQLKPFASTNFDTAIEWYFENLGFFSAALFYKNIDNFIVYTSREVVYSSLGLPASLLPPDKTVDSIFDLSIPQNMDSSTIKGFELAFSRDLDFLPAPFDNLGIIANYTYADGQALYRDMYAIEGNNQKKSFTGLSKNSYNFTLYYEQQQWGARMSAAYRSRYISDASSIRDQDVSGYHDTIYLDFTAFYQLSDSIKFNIEGMNLSNVREELYSDSNDRAYNTTTSGRTYLLGITGRF